MTHENQVLELNSAETDSNSQDFVLDPASAEQMLIERLSRITPLDAEAMEAAKAHQLELTKPAGSLGKLEALSVKLSGIAASNNLRIPARKSVIVMAVDHGVEAEGVSLYPQAVTAQMVYNFVAGGAAINVLARAAGANVVVVDMGAATEMAPNESVISCRIGSGTKNMATGPAMTRQQMLQALAAGIQIAEAEIDAGAGLLATGDMGIANTTPSAAITSVFTGRPVSEVTGRGTGIDDDGFLNKVAVIEKSLVVNQPNSDDPIDVGAKVGGFEIAGLAGVMIGAASRRVPVIIDGFISGAAALIASALSQNLSGYLIASHRSVEKGHQAALDHLGLEPLLDLNLRLGEGTGGALSMPIVEASIRVFNEMATFAQAGVSKADE